MRNIKLTISYEGTSFLGWQKTPLGPTIEESLEIALHQILQKKIDLQAASRTDAGVHAEGQVVNFLLDKETICLQKLQKSLNALLPPTIVILTIEEAALNFHPTLDNEGKEYHYLVCNTPFQKPKHRLFSWHVPYFVDLSKMQTSAEKLIGTHNFSSFCNLYKTVNKDPICTLYNLIIEPIEKDRFCFKVSGNRFLFRMVRNLIGTLIQIGIGKIPEENLLEILISKKRALAGVTAPAHGLHLMKVFYKEKGS